MHLQPEQARAPAPIAHLHLQQPISSDRAAIRIVPRNADSTVAVGQDLGTYRNPQDELMDTAAQLLQLGVKLSVLFAVARGMLQLYIMYWDDGKLWAKFRNIWYRNRLSVTTTSSAPLSPHSKCRVADDLNSIHHVS
jgi:hypothetical protein